VPINAEKQFDVAGQIRKAVDSLDILLFALREESRTHKDSLAKIGDVRSRLSSILHSDNRDLSLTIDTCIQMLDGAIRLAREAPVVPRRQAEFEQSIYTIQSLLYPLTPNKRSDPKGPPPLKSLAKKSELERRETQPSDQKRRQHKRVPLETNVDFAGETNFYTGFVEDISNGGLYVSTFNLLPIGTRIELSFTLPNGLQIEVPGQVRWIHDPFDPGDSSSPGMGIMFEELKIEDKKQIDAFIEERSPLFFDEDV